MPAMIPTALPACLMLPFAPLEAVGAWELELDAGGGDEELDAGAEELATVVEVGVAVSVALEVVGLGLALVTRVDVAGAAAVVSSDLELAFSRPRL